MEVVQRSAYYVCKHETQGVLEAWVKERDEKRSLSLAEPAIPESVGAVILQICEGMAKRANFNGYSYIEEMKGDAIYDCLRATKNYKADHVKQNPFGYFSRIAWNAFVQRINIERAEQKTKQELFLDENYEAYHIIEGDEADMDKNSLRQHFNFGE